VLAALACLSACSSDSTPDLVSAPTTTTTVPATTTTLADAYASPEDLPEEHGTLLRHEPVEGLVDGGVLERVLYSSTSDAGDPIAVSGLIAYPTGTPPEGGWPVVTWAHGTVGVGDSCAPSKDPAKTFTRIAAPLIAAGTAVLGTDYEGLGTPGRHPYLDGQSEGRGVLDIVRAARDLPGADLSDRFVVFGHSQGGHAAEVAGELAATWVPELHHLGTIAAAPATELSLIARSTSRGVAKGFGVLLAAGLNAAHPTAELDQILGPKALEQLKVIDEKCLIDVMIRYGTMPDTDVFIADPSTTEPWASLLRAADSGHRTSEAPLLIVHGTADEVVSAILSELLFKRLCGLGQVVERKTYEGANHLGVLLSAGEDIRTWIGDRFAGADATSNCP
jgi:alpha-beta hydrolase superfamily lysophospholipase